MAVNEILYFGSTIVNLKNATASAADIRSGTTAYGADGGLIHGTMVGDEGGLDQDAVAFIDGTLSTLSLPSIPTLRSHACRDAAFLTDVYLPDTQVIGDYAFASCSALTTISAPNATHIGGFAFSYCSSLLQATFPMVSTTGLIGSDGYEFGEIFAACSSLTYANFPCLKKVPEGMFSSCVRLSDVSLPLAETISANAFALCTRLSTISLPKATIIYNAAFVGCTSLKTVYLMGSTFVSLRSSNAFSNCGIGTHSGAIYVPSSMVDTYKADSVWKYFSYRIYAG